MSESPQQDMRRAFVDAISAYSEDQWAAGWLNGVEEKVRRQGGTWTVLAFLAGGWPRLSERTFAEAPGETHEERWESLMDWEPLTSEEEDLAVRFLAKLPRLVAAFQDLPKEKT